MVKLLRNQKYGITIRSDFPDPKIREEVKFGYTCQEEWYRPSWAISHFCFVEVKKSEWFASNTEEITNIEKFLAVNPKVFYLDAFSVLCPDLYCKNYDDLSQIYKDFSHLTSYGAMKLSNIFETFIRSK